MFNKGDIVTHKLNPGSLGVVVNPEEFYSDSLRLRHVHWEGR